MSKRLYTGLAVLDFGYYCYYYYYFITIIIIVAEVVVVVVYVVSTEISNPKLIYNWKPNQERECSYTR